MKGKTEVICIVVLLSLSSFAPLTHLATADQDRNSLINTIQNLVKIINWTSDLDTAYMGLNFGKVTLQQFQTMIDSLPSNSWATIIFWYAITTKYGIQNQTTIKRALDAATIMPNGLPTETSNEGKPCFSVHTRYLIYGYYWANKYRYNLTKWNITLAYDSYDTAVKYSYARSGAPPLWIYGDNTAETFSGRYYDETGESLDGYLEFYKFGVPQALDRAENLWNLANSHYWNGAYYGYQGPNGSFECAAGGFEQIAWKLYHYNHSISNTTNLIADFNTRYLASLWNSPQWLFHVIQHANTNPQRRLENTLMSWASIMGAYSSLPTSNQTAVQKLLDGTAYGGVNNNTLNEPAWSLLSNPSAGLYDPSSGMYRYHSDSSPNDFSTALAANLLMYLGIIQTTAKLAIPLEEINYEYTYNIIDKDLFAMDLATNSIKLPIMGTGNLTFLYGVTPISYDFSSCGVWNITFSSDWNEITSAVQTAELPTNRIYFITDVSGQNSTDVGGVINKDTTWTKTKSPYNLTGPLLVSNGVTLTIEAGTTVNLNDYYIKVNGTIRARGNITDPINIYGGSDIYPNYPITFTSYSSGWNEPTGTGSTIERAVLNLTTIDIQGASPKISNNTLKDSAIQINEGSPVIVNNTLQGSAEIHSGISVFAVECAIISGNSLSGYQTGIEVCTYGNSTIEDNLISGNIQGIQIVSYPNATDGTPIVKNNTITENSNGISLIRQSDNGTMSPLISGNNIYGNINYNINSSVSDNINATYNWWGTTNINETIFDFKNDFNLGTVNFVPFLTEPNLNAPAIPAFTISASVNAGGSISPSGTISVYYGDNQAFNIIANTGYYIVDVIVNGNSVGPVSSYTFSSVQASCNILAIFAPDPTPPTPPTPFPTQTLQPERLSIVLSPQHSEININQKVNFTASVSGGTPPYSCHWYSQYESFANPMEEVATSSSFIFTPNSSGTYYIRFSATDSLGESAGQFLTPISVTVSEYPLPSLSATPSPSPTPSITPSNSPTQQPTLEPTQSAQPTEPQHSQPLPFSLIIIVAAAIVAVPAAGLAVYLKQKQKKKEVR